MQKRISFLLVGLAVLLSLTATPGAFARSMPPETEPGEPPIDDGGGEGGGGIYTPSVPPFNPPPRPFLFASDLTLYGQINHPGYQSCNQVAHVWVGGGSDVTQGTTLYGTGVVVPNSLVYFGFYNAAGTLVKTHLTQAARSNCVVHYEPEAIGTWDLAPGYYYIYASYWGLSPWNSTFDTLAGYPLGHVGVYISPLRIR